MREPGPVSRNPRCADTARDRSDPIGATAVSARRWLLIEHPGPWAFDAFGSSGIATAVRERIVAAGRASRTRLLLVRRAGRIERSDRRSWAVVEHEPASIRWGSWAADEDLLAAADLLTGRREVITASAPVDQPLLLVCTHGRHDTCCAVRGRPVAAALQQHWPDATWECSHVGGDRFAPNLVVLPDGAYYGNLEPREAVDVVEAHRAGRLSVRHLRGLTSQSPVVQAAVIAAHERFGPAGARDAVCTGLEQVAEDRWRVHLAGTGALPPAIEATVTRARREAALLTCHAHQPSGAWSYDVPQIEAGVP